MSSIWLTFLPIDADHTRVIGGALTHPLFYEQMQASKKLQDENTAAINAINHQDASAMVDLQRNANSRYAEPGLLSEKEGCLLYFYRYLHKQLDTAYQDRDKQLSQTNIPLLAITQ